VERYWCKYLCPLGAVLAVFNKLSPLRVAANHERCNDCGRCDHSCPMDIPEPQDNTRSAECIRCLECLETCARPEAVTLRLG
jgi:polyferredoxin